MPGISVSKYCVPFNKKAFSYSSYWTTRGVTPGADATLITTEINAALQTHSYVKITEPGIYDIDDTIYIPSNRTLEFVAGCTLRKKTGSAFSHVIANKGILTRTANTNINLIANGLVVDVNAIDGAGTFPVYGLRGQVAFYKLTNFTISGLETTTLGSNQFFLHIANASDGTISDIEVHGDKDGIHIGNSHDLVLEDIDTYTLDDGIALNAFDYAISNPELGDIYNITIRRWTDHNYVGQGGSGCLMLAGSWATWTSGNDYQLNDAVVNNGRIYQKTNAGTIEAANAPVHTTGSVTGADGIEWTWRQDGVITNADVYNITFEDITWSSNRRMSGMINQGDENLRPTYPGTFGNSIVDDIVFDGVAINTPSTTHAFYVICGNFGDLYINNSTTVLTNGIYLVQVSPNTDGIAIGSVNVDGCDFTSSGTSIVFYNSISETTEVINLTDTIFRGLDALYAGNVADSQTITINANNCSFIDKIGTLIGITDLTNTTVNFVADGCTFHEPVTTSMFTNNTASNTLNIDTTNSLGESIPNLTSGSHVDVTGSDLVLALGDNVFINGKFRTNISGFTATSGALSWNEADESMKHIADGTAGNIQIYKSSVLNPLSDNIRVTFKAKSSTQTNTLTVWNAGWSALTAVSNPGLTTNWQNYSFEGARGAASGQLWFKIGTSIPNGAEFYIDDVEVVQYTP